MQAEVCELCGWAAWELQDLIFSKALLLDDASPRALRVTAVQRQDSADGVNIAIASLPQGSDWVTHATCQGVQLDVHSSSEPAATPDDDAMREDYPVNTLYSQLSDGGFDYGHDFQ